MYIRVSTDEQADKGYSQRSQFEVLTRHCEQNFYKVRHVIYEDHSAKTFDRPEWQKYLSRIKNNRGRKKGLILFTKWDRFSRNAGDAYTMINLLKVSNIEPQAIEQPLDMAIPESKIMLAIYLATPEVENDRRALNIFYGIRRATKEGRYLKKAPYGYKNKAKEDGTKFIDVVDKEAGIIREAFNLVATGDFSVEHVFRSMREKGLRMSKANFWRMLRSKHYIGKIFVAAFKDEDAHYVEGQHDGIVDLLTFKNVQDILDGKRSAKIRKSKPLLSDRLPLRGFLFCPICEKNISGSGSKSKTGKYHYYYHCKSPCKFRIRAEIANNSISQLLNDFTVRPEIVSFIKDEITGLLNIKLNHNNQNRDGLMAKIEKANSKLKKARDLLMEDKIDSEDFNSIKRECQREIDSSENQISALKLTPKKDFKVMIDRGLMVMGRLGELYENASVEEKKIILSSTFFKKSVFRAKKFEPPKSTSLLILSI